MYTRLDEGTRTAEETSRKSQIFDKAAHEGMVTSIVGIRTVYPRDNGLESGYYDAEDDGKRQRSKEENERTKEANRCRSGFNVSQE
jgi:hypothetical protein